MEKQEKLGEGTFGIVYSAISPNTNKTYAVKRNLSEDGTSFIGVLREVDMLVKLCDHPNIVKLEKVAFGEPFNKGCFSPLKGQERADQKDDSMHFIFRKAPYDMHTYISQDKDFRLEKKFMVDILLGTEYMHVNKIIHRDLKPSNILIFEDATAKICDFGLAKPYTYQGEQTPNTVTSWYRAPEIALGYPHYDYKADIWSIGCIFFELVSGRPFIGGVEDDNDKVLSKILGALPEKLPLRKMRQLVKSNKWRKINLNKTHNPATRRSFKAKLGLSNSYLKQFANQAGDLSMFVDLLAKMLCFDWDDRYTSSQCLDHPFFSDYKLIINKSRKLYTSHTKHEEPILIRPCIERKWMSQTVTTIFNNRHSLNWYSHRVLFQAMDLYDRYLHVMFRSTKIHPNSIESDLKGLIHDKFNSELRFMTCVYLCVKYFSSLHHATKFESVVSSDFRTEEAKRVAEQFEGGLVKNCLEYNIYRPTLYESADLFSIELDEQQICDLIAFYTMNNSFSGMKPSQLFNYYLNNLQGKPIESFLLPIIPSSS